MERKKIVLISSIFILSSLPVQAKANVPCKVVWEFIADGLINPPLILSNLETDNPTWKQRVEKCLSENDGPYNWSLVLEQNWIDSRLESLPDILAELKVTQTDKYESLKAEVSKITSQTEKDLSKENVDWYIRSFGHAKFNIDLSKVHPDLVDNYQTLLAEKNALLNRLQNFKEVSDESVGVDNESMSLTEDNLPAVETVSTPALGNLISAAKASIVSKNVMPFRSDVIQNFFALVDKNNADIQSNLTVEQMNKIQSDPELQKALLTMLYSNPLSTMGYEMNDTLKAGAIKFLEDDLTMDESGNVFVGFLATFISAANKLYEFGLIDEQTKNLLVYADKKK